MRPAVGRLPNGSMWAPEVPGLRSGICILGHGARAAEEGLEPPTTVVNGHPLSRLSYSAKARTGSRHAPGGSHAGFPCVLSTAGRCLQDGPGCATPAASDPYRTRTCVRCLRGSRPTARRTGRGYRFERKVEVRTPRPSRPPPGSRPGAGHSSSTFHSMVSPVRFERTTPAFGGQRSLPLS